jgi:hypothetical protein
MPAMTPRSWVIMMTLAPVASLAVWSTSRTWACTVTSSAVLGSSAMSRSGSLAIAIAMTARWRMPPEYSWGYARARCGAFGMPTRSSSSTARRFASCLVPVPRRCASTASAT